MPKFVKSHSKALYDRGATSSENPLIGGFGNCGSTNPWHSHKTPRLLLENWANQAPLSGWNKLQAKLDKGDMEFHSIPLKKKRDGKFVIQELSIQTSNNRLIKQLKKQGVYGNRHCKQLKAGGKLYLVYLKPGYNQTYLTGLTEVGTFSLTHKPFLLSPGRRKARSSIQTGLSQPRMRLLRIPASVRL